MTEKTYSLTTPIYYLSGRPHMGTAYCSLAADVMARFKRLDGYDVNFLTGTDEHGLKVLQNAQKHEMRPQDYCDMRSKDFEALTPLLGLTNNDFIRTTEERHKKGARELWQRLTDKGFIYKGSYSGWYAVSDEAYYDEGELITNDKGEKIAPSGAVCEWMEEESYFFKLSKFQEPLLKLYREQPDFILPTSRCNEITRFVEGGLNDLSISRTTFDWGIKVPGDDGHVMYVWIDALMNYISALGWPENENDPEGLYQKFWPNDVHIVGKDIQRFHTVYWPAFLMAAELPLPKRVFSHGWWTVEGKKMSKSLGNVIDTKDLINTYGLDPVRYFLLREVPFGNDGSFSHSSMIQRMNSELANDLGNLAQRTLSMVAKNCDGKVPIWGKLSTEDNALMTAASTDLLKILRQEMDVQAFHKALEATWKVIRDGNAYIDAQAPWKLKKEDPERMATVLYVLMESLRHIAIAVHAVMPTSMDKLLDQLGANAAQRDFASFGENGALQSGTSLPTPEGIFPRFVIEENEQAA